MERKATSVWRGSIKTGQGEISTASGALNKTPYSFNSRFGEGFTGTNPEELVSAAHSGCFAMALAGALDKKGYTPESLEVSAHVTVEKDNDGFKVSKSRLMLRARVPDIDEKEFKKIAEDAKVNCPISKLLKADITLDIDFHASMSTSHKSH